MTTLSVCYIVLDEAEFIEASIKSVIDFVDEVVIVDGGSTDGTLEIIDSFKNKKIKVIHQKWNNDFGIQRNNALAYATGDYVLQLDSDEILADNGFLLKEIIEKNPNIDVFDIEYIHFIRDLGHIDATVPVHIGVNRLFKRQGTAYTRHLHELAENLNWTKDEHGNVKKGFINQVKLFHLGYLKGITTIAKKYQMNLQNKSPVHTKEYLRQWRNAHCFGKYPVKEIDPATFGYPEPIIELFGLRE